MIVWGGNIEGTVGTGARYDLTNDLWTPTSLVDAPSKRGEHSAVWTGAGMIVWGGEEDYYHQFSDGSMYVPEADHWVALRPENSPQPRSSHTAVLADGEMIVWGGVETSAADQQSNHVQAAFYELDDRDGDGLRSADDCDDLNPHCTTDCTDADSDRYCVTHDCDDAVPTCDTDCVTDIDLDGVYDCADGCLDFDGDGHGSPGGAGDSCAGADCDEANVNCTTDCTDADTDSYCVTSDCDDADPDTHPGASEINDGLDNHCPGDHGYGAVDEISGLCGFDNPADGDEFSWVPQPGATSYEVARSTDLHFAGDCVVHATTETYWNDGTPVPLDTCFRYLVRATQPNVGSWGVSSSGVERTPVCP